MSIASQVTASAPGKLILMGEHAAVYGRPALVVAFGLRTRVRLLPRDDSAVRLALGDLGLDESLDWTAITAYGDATRRAWEGFIDDASSESLHRMSAADPAHVVKIAMAEAVRAVGGSAPGLDVEVASELPLGAGFGSSASVAVALGGALVALLEGKPNDAATERVALEVERRQHGRPSGVDHATVLRGGVRWMERGADGALTSESLELTPGALGGLVVLHTGSPVETTGELVEAVRLRFADRGAELEALLDGMAARVVELRDLLTGDPQAGAADDGRLETVIRRFERDLERLGVVPEAVQAVIRGVEETGGAAKISGAGALSGSAAGSLLAYHPTENVGELACLAPFRRFDAELGAPGLRVEVAD